MYTSIMAVGLSTVLGFGPLGHGGAGCQTCGTPGGSYYMGGAPSMGYMPQGYGSGGFDTGGYPGMSGGGSGSDQLYPFDSQEPWQHGYFQEIPAYGGYRLFRPYNYQHVMPQTQTAGSWGMPTALPYSQQYWHRYQNQGALRERRTQAEPAANVAAAYAAEVARLRAQLELQGRQQQVAVPRSYPGASNPQAYTPPPAATTALPQYAIDPAQHQRFSRIEQLQYHIQQQAIQLQTLQNALQQEYQQTAPPLPLR